LGAPARRLDLGRGRLREGVGAHGERGARGELAVAQHLDQAARARVEEARADEGFGPDLAALREAPGEVAHVHHRELAVEGVLEAALGEPPVERHLPALEAGALPATRARLVPLVALRRRLAVARPGAAPHAFAGLPGPARRPEIAELHAERSFILGVSVGAF